MRSRPGPWLQLAALAGAAGALLAVVSGTLGLGHEYVSALAVPPEHRLDPQFERSGGESIGDLVHQ